MSNPEEIKDQLYNDVIDGDTSAVVQGTHAALDAHLEPAEILYEALIPALTEVGALFESGQYFVPEMLISAKSMKAGLEILRPLLAAQGAKPVGTYLILTVKGDIHDIGKDLVRVMLEGAGFRVIDLGVNVPPEKMIEAIKEHQPEIVGFSAFLTTTMPMFKTNIEALKEAGLRDKVKIMVGGAPITEEYARHVGADGFAAEATSATRMALDFIKNPETSKYLLRPEDKSSAKTFAKAAGSGVLLAKPPRRLPAKPATTSLERVLAVLRHQEPDRVPHFEWVQDVSVIQAMTRGGTYFDLIEQYDIDGVMTGPETARRAWATASLSTSGARCGASARTTTPCRWTTSGEIGAQIGLVKATPGQLQRLLRFCAIILRHPRHAEHQRGPRHIGDGIAAAGRHPIDHQRATAGHYEVARVIIAVANGLAVCQAAQLAQRGLLQRRGQVRRILDRCHKPGAL